MTSAEGGEDGTEQTVLFMVDPAVAPPDGEAEFPVESIAGVWEPAADGTPWRFRANPDYEPSTPDSPTDPVDLVLRRLAGGEADGEELLEALAEIDLAVALDVDGAALLRPAPDGVTCVLVTTAPAHRAAVEDDLPVDSWREATLGELGAILPDEGIDVLLNPRGTAAMRLVVAALRDAAVLARTRDDAIETHHPAPIASHAP